MKKSNILKIFMTLVLAFVITGAFAQTYPAAITGADGNDYEDVAEDIYQTTGLGLFLYVAPDPVYSPSYDETTNSGYNAGSEWQWVTGADFASGSVEKAWTDENYVEILSTDLPAAGNTVTYWVAERFGATCADATGQSINVTVLPAPTGAMAATNASTSWTEVTAGSEYYQCGDGHTDDLRLTFTETGVPATLDYYAYTVTVTATGYDADGNPVVGPTDVTGSFGFNRAATDAGFLDGPTEDVTTAAMTFVQNGGVDVQTKYEFTLATVASRISTVSYTREGTANAFYAEAGADDVVTYWLNLPPVTGPIYHIPNNFNL